MVNRVDRRQQLCGGKQKDAWGNKDRMFTIALKNEEYSSSSVWIYLLTKPLALG